MTQTGFDVRRLATMPIVFQADSVPGRKPDFFIVGAPRCGTTAVYTYLRRHPSVFMPDRKEPHFFCDDFRSRHFVADESDYLSLFEPARPRAIVGEASVFYLASTVAARRIRAFNPAAKIIALLRDPIDMIHSNFLKNLSLRVETERDFGRALDLETERTEGALAPIVDENDGFKLRYLANARFADQLERYLDAFGAERLFVVVYDDLKNDPAELYRRLCLFLEIEPIRLASFEPINQSVLPRFDWLDRFLRRPPVWATTLTRYATTAAFRRKAVEALIASNSVVRPRGEISATIRRRLADRLRPDVDRLESLIGRDLSHWCRADSGTSQGHP